MNFELAQIMVHRPRVLRGGKAPLFFKRELSGLTEELGTMPRRCDWVREIAETHPHLLSEPLLGTCLAAVTTTRVVRSESNDESTDGRLTSPHLGANRGKEIAMEPTAVSKREQIRSPALRSQIPGDTRQFEMVAQLPRRAPDSLLRRTAPDTSNLGEKLLATSSVPRRGSSSPSVHSSQKVTRSEWLRTVADRAAKKWISNWVFAPTRKYSSPAVASNRSERSRTPEAGTNTKEGPASPSLATVETTSLPSLNDDWLLPIGGQQASPQLLTSLVKHARSDLDAPEKDRRSKESPGGIDSEPHSLSSSPDLLDTGKRSSSNGPEFSRPFKVDRQSPSLPANANLSSLLESPIDPEAREQRASPEFAPTVLTHDLSPLLPPVTAGSPALPAAANAARRIAWRDEVEAHGTDLSVLAAQMKRILDEEARRHGIDV
jgi:hypothetical protein